jgi:hypothetical protein
MAIFQAATITELGNGMVSRARICEFAPNLLAVVPKRLAKSRTVREGLLGAWLTDYRPNLSEAALNEFFLVWESIHTIQLHPGKEDTFNRRWEADVQYSACRPIERSSLPPKVWTPSPSLLPFVRPGAREAAALASGCVVARKVWASVVLLWGKLVWAPDAASPLMFWWIGKTAPMRDR